MCSKCFKLVLQDNTCEIRKGFGTIVVAGRRTHGNIYHFKGVDGQCLVSKVCDSWIWHWRMGHVKFDNIVRISSREVV